ncbi:MAG: stage V sporulation protein S [Anaerolineae bacterium]
MTLTAAANSRHGLLTNSSQVATLLPFIPGDARPMDLIKVSANSRSTAVAGAIAGIVRDQGHAEMQAIGASAVNQAIKAIAIAHGYLQLDNIDIVCVPSFTEVAIDGNERTAVRISIEKR